MGETVQKTEEERFWGNVKKSSGCWEWTSYKNNYGYGRFRRNGKEIGAHRCSYEFAFGPIPSGMFILHRCDNPGCVRPDHLFAGTQKDNLADCQSKGRIVTTPKSGEENGYSKLTMEQVKEIRKKRDAGDLLETIAAEYGVTASNVSMIAKRKTWKHIEYSIR